MPRGRGRGGHKGQRRHFTNPDELAVEKEKEERERKWREQRGEISSDEEEEEEAKSSSSSSEDVDDDDAEKAKAKGVQHLIDIENPNRVLKKDKKITQLDGAEEEEVPELSRREREELEKQKARAHYLKMHAAGKTAEAKADLARLALIRRQREDAAKKRDEERLAKEAAAAAKTEAKHQALGKKS